MTIDLQVIYMYIMATGPPDHIYVYNGNGTFGSYYTMAMDIRVIYIYTKAMSTYPSFAQLF